MARKRQKRKKNNPQNSGHYVPLQRPRAVHALLSDQYTNLLGALRKIPDHTSLAATNPRADQQLKTHTSGKGLFILGHT